MRNRTAFYSIFASLILGGLSLQATPARAEVEADPSAPVASARPLYDLKEDGTHRFKARGSVLEIEEKSTRNIVAVAMHAKALEIAYDRLYVAQGAQGLIAFELSALKAHRPGQKLKAVERILNLDAHGIAIDPKRQIIFISRFQSPQNPGLAGAGTMGISVWHFPDPKEQKVPVFPVVPIAFHPVPTAAGLAYDAAQSRLYVAARHLGIGSFDVRQTGERIELLPRGVTLPPDQRGEAQQSLWWGVGISPNKENLLISSQSTQPASVRGDYEETDSIDLARFEVVLGIARRQHREALEAELFSPGKDLEIFALKAGHGFFSFMPDSDHVDVLYKAQAMEMLESGQITQKDYDTLMRRLAPLEAAGRITGSTAFVALTSVLPMINAVRAAGGVSALTVAARVALANPRALLPAVIRSFAASGRAREIVMDFFWSTAMTAALDWYLDRPKDLFIRDMVLMTGYSAILSFCGLSKGISAMKRAYMFASSGLAATHITINIEGNGAEEWWRTQAFTLVYATMPILPWSSLFRYQAIEKMLLWIEKSTGSKADPIFAPALAAWFKTHPKFTAATLFATNQGYATVAYVKSDEFYRSVMWPDSKTREGYKIVFQKETAPFRALLTSVSQN